MTDHTEILNRLDREAATSVRLAWRGERVNSHLLPVDVARERFETEMAQISASPEAQGVRAEDFEVPLRARTVDVRMYRSRDQLSPVIVYLHGGGWVTGSIATHDVVCRSLALATGCAIVSVNYRLAPENPYSAAVSDATEVTFWVCRHASDLNIDASRLAVPGDSAEANLAMAVSLLAAGSKDLQISMQILVYPITPTDLNLYFDN